MKTHGKTASGVTITDEMVEELAKEVEEGYDVEQTLRRRGQPTFGSTPASVKSVRLDREPLTQPADRGPEPT